MKKIRTDFLLNSILAVKVGYLRADKMLHRYNCLGMMSCDTSPLVFSRIIVFFLKYYHGSNTVQIFPRREDINLSALPNWLHVRIAIPSLIPHVGTATKTHFKRRQLLRLCSTYTTNSLLYDPLRINNLRIHKLPWHYFSLVIPDLWFHVKLSWLPINFYPRTYEGIQRPWSTLYSRKTMNTRVIIYVRSVLDNRWSWNNWQQMENTWNCYYSHSNLQDC